MDAIQDNSIILFSLLGLAEWAVLGTVVALLISRLYVKKSRQLRALQRQQPQAVQAPTPTLDIKAQLHTWIEQTEKQLRRANDQQAQQLQARIAFLQSELIAAENAITQDYWEDMCLRLSSILPQTTDASTPTDDEEVTVAAAAELLEVPDYLDDFELISDIDEIEDHAPSDKFDSVASDDKNAHIAKIRANLQQQFAALKAVKDVARTQSVNENRSFRHALEQSEVANAHMRLALDALAKEIEQLKQSADRQIAEPFAPPSQTAVEAASADNSAELRGTIVTMQASIDDLQQQVEDRELIIEQLQSELEALRTQLLLQQREAQQSPRTATANARVFNETDDPDQLTHQIESLTNLLVQKSEQLAELQSDIPLPDDAFESGGAIHPGLAQQENNQSFLPQLDDVVHPSYVSASYELTPQQEAMIEAIDDIDLSVDDDYDLMLPDDDDQDPPLSNAG